MVFFVLKRGKYALRYLRYKQLNRKMSKCRFSTNFKEINYKQTNKFTHLSTIVAPHGNIKKSTVRIIGFTPCSLPVEKKRFTCVFDDRFFFRRDVCYCSRPRNRTVQEIFRD